MDHDASYYRDAVRYNEVLAEAAEGVATQLVDPTIKKWATGVGKQHRWHEKRHRGALAKLERGEELTDAEQSYEPSATAVGTPLPEGLEITQIDESVAHESQEVASG